MVPEVPTSEMQGGVIEFEGDGSAAAGVDAAMSASVSSAARFGERKRMGPPQATGGRVACCRLVLRAAAAEIILRPVGRRNGKRCPREVASGLALSTSITSRSCVFSRSSRTTETLARISDTNDCTPNLGPTQSVGE
jgi:hypothetical protein